jgi:hypothetical protein
MRRRPAAARQRCSADAAASGRVQPDVTEAVNRSRIAARRLPTPELTDALPTLRRAAPQAPRQPAK